MVFLHNIEESLSLWFRIPREHDIELRSTKILSISLAKNLLCLLGTCCNQELIWQGKLQKMHRCIVTDKTLHTTIISDLWRFQQQYEKLIMQICLKSHFINIIKQKKIIQEQKIFTKNLKKRLTKVYILQPCHTLCSACCWMITAKSYYFFVNSFVMGEITNQLHIVWFLTASNIIQLQ